jgi:hypothetical protein
MGRPADNQQVRGLDQLRSPPYSNTSPVGFWVVDVKDEARAIEIAAQISRAADAAIEVRQCMDAPPDEVSE